MLNGRGFAHEGWRIAATALALAGAITLAGCGKTQESTAAVGQVIAHVGPDDITQQELDNELRLANIPTDKRTDEVVKAILTRVIERKYLVQQAIAAKLDREPTVHLDLLRSREQILAGAYVQRELGQKITGLSKTEADNFIQAHPDQFAKRQVFNIEQIVFAPVKDMDSLAASTKDFKTMDQVEAKLKDLGVKYSRGPSALDGATMPVQMLSALQARKPDDVFFVRSRNNASFFKVTSVDDKPISGEDAQVLAKRDLANELARKTGEDTSKAALATAKYEGDYARIMSTAAPAAPAAEAAPAAAQPADESSKESQKN